MICERSMRTDRQTERGSGNEGLATTHPSLHTRALSSLNGVWANIERIRSVVVVKQPLLSLELDIHVARFVPCVHKYKFYTREHFLPLSLLACSFYLCFLISRRVCVPASLAALPTETTPLRARILP